VPTIDIYIDDDALRRRRRGKWLIPLIVGLFVAIAVQREKAAVRVATAPPPQIIYEKVYVTQPPVSSQTATVTQAIVQPLPAHIAATPARIDFGEIPPAGRPPAQMATIRNDGGSPIAVNAAVTGPFLTTSACEKELAPGEQCAIAIVFAPMKAGPSDGTLRIAAGAQRTKIALHGTVRPEVIAAPEPLPPPQPLPQPVPQNPPPPPQRALCFDPPLIRFTAPGRQRVTITNPENTPLRVAAIEPIGTSGQKLAGYTIDAGRCLRMMDARERCTFTITASAVALQLHNTMQVAVYYDDPFMRERRIARVASDCR